MIFDRETIERRSWIRHRRIKIRELTFQIFCQVQGFTHRFEVVIRQSEYEVADDVNAGFLDLADNAHNVERSEFLLRAASYMLAARFDSEREPANSGGAQQAQLRGF